MKSFQYSAGGIRIHRWRGHAHNGNYEDIRWAIDDDVVNEIEFLDFLSKASLLVIDDISTREKYTDAQHDNLLEVIDSREGKPLIVTSNISPRAMHDAKTFDERILSRICCGTMFELKCKDRRFQPKA